MNYDLGTVVTRLFTIQPALACEPNIRPDLTALSLDRLPVVVLALMNRGVRTAEDLHAYLVDHGSTFDREVLKAVLDRYASTTRLQDGGEGGLWSRSGDSYVPNVSVTQ
jgi:hypothetical protein